MNAVDMDSKQQTRQYRLQALKGVLAIAVRYHIDYDNLDRRRQDNPIRKRAQAILLFSPRLCLNGLVREYFRRAILDLREDEHKDHKYAGHPLPES